MHGPCTAVCTTSQFEYTRAIFWAMDTATIPLYKKSSTQKKVLKVNINPITCTCTYTCSYIYQLRGKKSCFEMFKLHIAENQIESISTTRPIRYFVKFAYLPMFHSSRIWWEFLKRTFDQYAIAFCLRGEYMSKWGGRSTYTYVQVVAHVWWWEPKLIISNSSLGNEIHIEKL